MRQRGALNMGLAQALGAALLLAASLSAWARTSCSDDERRPRVCCDSWHAEVLRSGRPSGSLWQERYADLVQEIARARRTDGELCRYFGAADSACVTTYGLPQCADQQRDRPGMGWSEAEKAAVTQRARGLLQNFRELLERAARNYREARHGEAQGDRYAGIGTVTRDYGKLVAEAIARFERIRTLLGQLQHDHIDTIFSEITIAGRELEQYGGQLRALGPSIEAIAAAAPKPAVATAGREAGATPPAAPAAQAAPRAGAAAAGGGAACAELSSCLRLLDATWDSRAAARADGASGGRIEVSVANSCEQELRLALWLPAASGFRSSMARLGARQQVKLGGMAERNEWHLKTAPVDAREACLQYP